MPGVTKVNGFVQSDQFFGRDVAYITVTPSAACPARVGGELVKWDELDACVSAIQTRYTVSVVGTFDETDTAVKMIIEGIVDPADANAYDSGNMGAELTALVGDVDTGATVSVDAF